MLSCVGSTAGLLCAHLGLRFAFFVLFQGHPFAVILVALVREIDGFQAHHVFPNDVSSGQHLATRPEEKAKNMSIARWRLGREKRVLNAQRQPFLKQGNKKCSAKGADEEMNTGTRCIKEACDFDTASIAIIPYACRWLQFPRSGFPGSGA